jgi:hypothetical protein
MPVFAQDASDVMSLSNGPALREVQEAVPGLRPCNIVPAGTLEHDDDGRVVCWDDPALQPSCHIFYGAQTLWCMFQCM